MGLFDRFRAPLDETATVPREQYAAVAQEVEFLQESVAGLEQLAREDIGWRKLGMEQEQAFTRPGLLQIQSNSLAATIKSPILGRGMRIRRNYVWGGGLEIQAREAGVEDGTPEVNNLIQAVIDAPEYQRTLGSAQAREEREFDLFVRGEFFIMAVHDVAARTVRPRRVLAAQITDHISNPDDSTDVWFYRRDWTVNRVNLVTGAHDVQVLTEWHPTLDHRPAPRDRVPLIGGRVVRWDAPIQHCAVNSFTEAPYGLGDVYAAVDWAAAYADYLGAWAGLMKSLARYAFKVTAPAKHTAKVRQALQNGQGRDPLSGSLTDPSGATAVFTPDATMAPMHSSGATIDASSGKPLAGMAAAALDVPITMLLADPGVTGARATAETLDRPLELTTGSRQAVWVDWLKAWFAHVVLVAVEDGVLTGTVQQVGNTQRVALPEGVDATVDITFPPVEQLTPKERLEAIQIADQLGTLPPLLIVRKALEALGVEDIDEVLDDLTDDDGQFIDPRVTAQVDALRRERDGAPGSQAEEAYR